MEDREIRLGTVAAVAALTGPLGLGALALVALVYLVSGPLRADAQRLAYMVVDTPACESSADVSFVSNDSFLDQLGYEIIQ